MFAEDEADLLLAEAADHETLDAMVARRVAGEPLEQIVGWAEFCGRRFVVAPGAFVPRTRTSHLVAQADALAGERPVVLDLCCGVGAVGVALADRVQVAELHLTDIDPVAVACARRNAPDHRVWEGDLFAPLPVDLCGRVDVLLVNAPYVPTDEIAMMPPEARDHEHRVALDGGPDGSDVHRRVAAEASAWLAPRGVVLIETSVAQAPVTEALLTEAGLEPAVSHDPELGGTVVSGRRFR